jgi:hypothetical protein
LYEWNLIGGSSGSLSRPNFLDSSGILRFLNVLTFLSFLVLLTLAVLPRFLGF